MERQDCAWVLKDWDKQASDLDWIGSVKQERWLFELNSFCLHPSISDTLHKSNAFPNCIYGIPVSILSLPIYCDPFTQLESEHYQCISIHPVNALANWPPLMHFCLALAIEGKLEVVGNC